MADHDIDAGACMENRDVVLENIKSNLLHELPEEYVVKKELESYMPELSVVFCLVTE